MHHSDRFSSLSEPAIFIGLYILFVIFSRIIGFFLLKKCKAKIKNISTHDETDTNSYGQRTKPRKIIDIAYSYEIGNYEYTGRRVGIMDGLYMISNFDIELYSSLVRAYKNNREIDIWYKPSSPWQSFCYNGIYIDKVVIIILVLLIFLFIYFFIYDHEQQNTIIFIINIIVTFTYIFVERFNSISICNEVKKSRKLIKSKIKRP